MSSNAITADVDVTAESASASATTGWTDPREVTEVGVLMENGRLAPRHFDSRAEAEAWAQDGERVVEINTICDCDS